MLNSKHKHRTRSEDTDLARSFAWPATRSAAKLGSDLAAWPAAPFSTPRALRVREMLRSIGRDQPRTAK